MKVLVPVSVRARLGCRTNESFTIIQVDAIRIIVGGDITESNRARGPDLQASYVVIAEIVVALQRYGIRAGVGASHCCSAIVTIIQNCTKRRPLMDGSHIAEGDGAPGNDDQPCLPL